MKRLPALQALHPAATPMPRSTFGLFIDPNFQPSLQGPEQLSPSQRFAAAWLQLLSARSQHG